MLLSPAYITCQYLYMSCAVVKNEIILFGQMRCVGRNETLEPALGRCIVIKILSPEMIIDAQVAQCGKR